MRTELKGLHKRLGATFVYVTHDQAEAMTMADRIVVMSKGFIEQVGTPLQIYNRPATRFVAGFFGTPTMNFVEGTVELNGGGRRFRAPGLEQPLPDSVPSEIVGRKVVLGVRSEHVLLGDGAALKGTVQLTEISTTVKPFHWWRRLDRRPGCSRAAPCHSASRATIAICSLPTARACIECCRRRGGARPAP
jgi:ABC-type sugar transport system ATPase subunit